MKVLKYRQELRLKMLAGASKNWKMVNIKKVEVYLALVYHIDRYKLFHFLFILLVLPYHVFEHFLTGFFPRIYSVLLLLSFSVTEVFWQNRL